MPRFTAPDGSTACECGGRWMIATPKEWGLRVRCANDHVKDFPSVIVQRTRVVERMGGRGGRPEREISAPDPSPWMRLRLWWWRRRLRRVMDERERLLQG